MMQFRQRASSIPSHERTTMKLAKEELDAILAQGGLLLNQDYSPRDSYRKDAYLFTTCTTCGIEAHCRLKYILDKNAIHERVCRACYWRAWYREAHDLHDSSVQQMINRGISRSALIQEGVVEERRDATWEEAEKLADKHGYDLVDLIRGIRKGEDVLLVRCRACGRQTAERPGDVTFGCTCGGEKAKGGVVYDPSAAPANRTPDPEHPAATQDRGASTPSHASEKSPLADLDWDELSKTPCSAFPKLLAAWNNPKDPSSIPVTHNYPCKLKCPEGHQPTQTPHSYLTGGCVVCRGLATRAMSDKKFLSVTDPELAAEWERAIDGERYTPDNVAGGSKRKVKWRCIACGHAWVATVRDRQKRMNNRCPGCGKVMGSLAWKHPDLAAEWSPENPVSPWNTKPFGKLDFTPKWVCRKDPSHVWRATTTSRINKGKNCPYCES